MPVLSKFQGITIKMYFQQAEHNPPHIHAFYAGDVASIEIKTLLTLDGYLPPKKEAVVKEWILLYEEELIKMWDSQEFEKLPPLSSE